MTFLREGFRVPYLLADEESDPRMNDLWLVFTFKFLSLYSTMYFFFKKNLNASRPSQHSTREKRRPISLPKWHISPFRGV